MAAIDALSKEERIFRTENFNANWELEGYTCPKFLKELQDQWIQGEITFDELEERAITKLNEILKNA